ncbi:RING finger protein 11 [Caerostris extrusa]|uniref:RING finger protein 11 n=1 Tax=Caerostris extrusa TaxID=172846 RepID=A0AAV4W4H9_CAEEX|nr:RING finger protein 11 [Caerostris extrusa]
MGNCLKSVSTDDISLLRENQSARESSSDQLGPPPPYQETVSVPVYYPSPNVSRPASQLTEEEQIKIAQRIGLIQHLPTGKYDGNVSYVWENSILGIPFDFYLACISTILIALMTG